MVPDALVIRKAASSMLHLQHPVVLGGSPASPRFLPCPGELAAVDHDVAEQAGTVQDRNHVEGNGCASEAETEHENGEPRDQGCQAGARNVCHTGRHDDALHAGADTSRTVTSAF